MASRSGGGQPIAGEPVVRWGAAVPRRTTTVRWSDLGGAVGGGDSPAWARVGDGGWKMMVDGARPDMRLGEPTEWTEMFTVSVRSLQRM
jgi:hypothetical protein